MIRKVTEIVSLALLSFAFGAESDLAMNMDKCTAIAVGRHATVDKSTLNTHSADCSNCDFRINKVPAKDWPAGSKRNIYLPRDPYPSWVLNDRGFTWSPENLEDMPQRSQWETMTNDIIGYIPQVPHTFGLIEGVYGIMNEHQVSIGESTCASKLFAAPIGSGGKALLEIGQLILIALERSATAREALTTITDLAMKYGYYSAAWDVTTPFGVSLPEGEGGEALTISDPNEVWVLHITPDDTGTQAVWVAQRLPDDHITVLSNQFIIREVKKNSPDFLYSDNLWSVAERNGWWSPSDGHLNYLHTYGVQRYQPTYSTNRIWRVLSVAAPSLRLPFHTNDWGDDYPFSVKPDAKMTLEDIMTLLRDHFNGTPIDTAKGIAGGPYGDPNRFDPGVNGNLTVDEALHGAYPRDISIFRTTYGVISVGRKYVPDTLGVLWIASAAPDISSFVPVYVHSDELAKPYTSGTMQKYDTDVAWWNFNVLSNYASRFYSMTIGTIREFQQTLYENAASESRNLEEAVIRYLAYETEEWKEEQKRREEEKVQKQKEEAKKEKEKKEEEEKEKKKEEEKEKEKQHQQEEEKKQQDKSRHDKDNNDKKKGSQRGHSRALLDLALSSSTSSSPVVDHDASKVIDVITSFTVSIGTKTSNSWRDFLPVIMTTFRDGYVISGQTDVHVTPTSFFYPQWWLELTGYYDNAPNINGIMFSTYPNRAVRSESFLMSLLATIAFSGTVGFFFAKRKYSQSTKYVATGY